MSAYEIAMDTQVELHQALQAHHVLSVMGMRARGWDDEYVESVFDGARLAITQALPIYVADDTAAIWQLAAAEFAPEPVHLSDPLFPVGFAYIESVLNWRTPGGMALMPTEEDDTLYEVREAPDVGGAPVELALWLTIGNRIGVWGFAHRATLVKHGVQLDDGTGHTYFYKSGGKLSGRALDQFSGWHLVAFATFEEGVPPNDVENAAGVQMQSLWALMRDYVPVRHRASRPARRRAQRAELDHSGDVTVIRLRRQRKHDTEEPPRVVSYDHRWVVRGHWRNQWYPSQGLHRQRWVAPYVKGPDGKPLRLTDRAVEFTR